MNENQKTPVDEEARTLIDRAIALSPSKQSDIDFIVSARRYFRKWGWLSQSQKRVLEKIARRLSGSARISLVSAPNRVCRICRVKKIHLNDARYETRVCFSCSVRTPLASRPQQLGPVQKENHICPRSSLEATNECSQPTARSFEETRTAVHDGPRNPGTTVGAEAMRSEICKN